MDQCHRKSTCLLFPSNHLLVAYEVVSVDNQYVTVVALLEVSAHCLEVSAKHRIYSFIEKITISSITFIIVMNFCHTRLRKPIARATQMLLGGPGQFILFKFPEIFNRSSRLYGFLLL